MRTLASIQKIKDIQPIEGADRIQLASIKGWKVIIAKDDNFEVGSLCVFFEIDSVLPEREGFEFMAKHKYRVKTMKMRGVISQGLAMPLSILPDWLSPPTLSEQQAIISAGKVGILEGRDVTAELGVIKYEKPVSIHLAGEAVGSFPSFVPRTDEERIQNCPEILEKYKGDIFYLSEKMDGSSMTVWIDDQDELHVCSRNIEWERISGNVYWEYCDRIDIAGKLSSNPYSALQGYALQGELVGPGIQGNKYNIDEIDCFFFNVYISQPSESSRYYDKWELLSLIDTLGLKTVPMLGDITLTHTVDELVELSKGMSIINPTTLREGIVVRPLTETRDDELGRLSFKVVNPDFLLKENSKPHKKKKIRKEGDKK